MSNTFKKELPQNAGLRWTNNEEKDLLEELGKNLDIKTISEIHKRTTGSINARIKDIAYKLYKKGNSFEEIILITKLEKEQINDIIKNRGVFKKENSIKDELKEMKNEIKDLKNTINQLFDLDEINNLKNTVKELSQIMKTIYNIKRI